MPLNKHLNASCFPLNARWLFTLSSLHLQCLRRASRLFAPSRVVCAGEADCFRGAVRAVFRLPDLSLGGNT